ncbi:MAG: hypothetical protein KME08_08220 [Aphanothece sp. CMT-3BRIN-NPC111]|jgi:hypothetical protein|nr:hypothetical protein [Aphanothece sp. CMT-3BRIN-NPC111]
MDKSVLSHTSSSTVLSKGYCLIRLAKFPIIALPANSRRMKLAGLHCYQATSIKRTIFSWGMHLAIMTGIDKLLSEYVDSSLEPLLPFNFASWLDSVCEFLGEPSANAVVIWPSKRDRGRVYVHLLGCDAKPLAFIKLSLDAYTDRLLLAEANTLADLKAMGLEKFRIPSVLQQGSFQNHSYLSFQHIPVEAKPVNTSWDNFPAQCIQEYAGPDQFVYGEQLRKLPWWQRFWKVTEAESAFAQEVRDLQDLPLRVRRVHGDLVPANMVSVKDQLWIFDWEESCTHAPYMTDEIVFFLALNQRQILSNPVFGLRALAARYLSESS